MSLYNDLYEGFTLTFDLTKGQPCFRMDKDLSVVNIKDFKRKIKTDYEEGKEHTHTVCVPYYKAAHYNISHT